MGLAEGIRKHGFRKWYERELLGSHGWLVVTFLCLIGVFGAFEGLGPGFDANTRLDNVAAILLCTGTGVFALRRYLHGLMTAEMAANQAVCAQCKTYGRLEVASENGDGTVLRVRCRHCRHEWTIES